MLGRAHSVLLPRIVARTPVPHVLSAAHALHRDAAGAGTVLTSGGVRNLSNLGSLAVEPHAAVPPHISFTPTTTPVLNPPRLPDTFLQEAEREAPMLQAIRQLVAEGETGAFNMYDLEVVRSQLHRFRRNLPRVHPFYAMKCNPDERIVELLASEGANFDCASKAEIGIALRSGASADRIIFANPCKQPSHVAYAAASGVDISTFDGADELFKIHALQPNARLVFRVRVDDSHAVCTMSQKYGAPLAELPELLALATSLQLKVVGVSYHVGSGSMSAEPFADAVRTARAAFDLAAHHGHEMSVLDIGGGFPGTIAAESGKGDEPLLVFADQGAHKPPSFEEIAEVLRPALDEHFPASSGVKIIAEPGRYMVHGCSNLVTNIIGRKYSHRATGKERPMYFVNDGLYGSFNCVLYDHAAPSPLPLFSSADAAQRELDVSSYSDCSIWGSTCDGLDCISKEARLPPLSVGDWIRWPNMGAYTSAAGSTFNGMERPTNYYL